MDALSRPQSAILKARNTIENNFSPFSATILAPLKEHRRDEYVNVAVSLLRPESLEAIARRLRETDGVFERRWQELREAQS